jgi:dihydroflavonol-4-reductase
MLHMLSRITGKPAPRLAIPHFIPSVLAYLDEMILARYLGKTPHLSFASVQMSRNTMYYDSSKAICELGLSQSPIEVALEKAVSWFEARSQNKRNI